MGGSMGGTMETTRGYQKRRREAIKAEDAYWASLCGPVTIIRPASRPEDNLHIEQSGSSLLP